MLLIHKVIRTKPISKVEAGFCIAYVDTRQITDSSMIYAVLLKLN